MRPEDNKQRMVSKSEIGSPKGTLTARQADPELLELHGITSAKESLEALRNLKLRKTTGTE